MPRPALHRGLPMSDDDRTHYFGDGCQPPHTPSPHEDGGYCEDCEAWYSPRPHTCHCGAPTYTHPDGFTRGLCVDCDAVRCDAYPGECEPKSYATGGPNPTVQGGDYAVSDYAVLPAHDRALILALADQFSQAWPAASDQGIADWLRSKADQIEGTP